VVVRILAVLVTLGLLVSAADARELSAPPTAAALVDAFDDTAEDVAIVIPTPLTSEEIHALGDFALPDAPAGHQPCLYVFRPPRAYAFN